MPSVPLCENLERNRPRGRVTSNSCPTFKPCCAPASTKTRSPSTKKRCERSDSAPTISGWPPGTCCSMKPPHRVSLGRATGACCCSFDFETVGICRELDAPPDCALAVAAQRAQNTSTNAGTLQIVGRLLLRTGNLLVCLSHQRLSEILKAERGLILLG